MTGVYVTLVRHACNVSRTYRTFLAHFFAQHNPMLHLAHSRYVSKFVQYTHLTLSQSYGATGSALELTPFTAIYCAPDPDSVNTAEKIAEVRSDSLYIRACLEYQKQDD